MSFMEALRGARESLEAELDRIRGQIQDAKDEISYLENAPPPKAELIAALQRNIATWAEGYLQSQGRPSPERNLAMPADGGTTPGVEMIAALLAPQLAEGAARHVEALDFEPGPPTAERPAALRDARAELLELERAEEDLYRQAREAGITLTRRDDASPEAILRVGTAAPLSGAHRE